MVYRLATISPEQRQREQLTNYLFQQLWHGPAYNLRQTGEVKPLTPQLIRRTVQYFRQQVTIDNPGLYYCYVIPSKYQLAIRTLTTKWQYVDQWLNQYNFDWELQLDDGRLLPNYTLQLLRPTEDCTNLLLLVPASVIKTMVGELRPPTLFLRFSVDGRSKFSSYRERYGGVTITAKYNRAVLRQKCQGKQLWHNGRMLGVTSLPDELELQPDDLLEWRTPISSYQLEIDASDRHLQIYHNGTAWLLCHLPKAWTATDTGRCWATYADCWLYGSTDQGQTYFSLQREFPQQEFVQLTGQDFLIQRDWLAQHQVDNGLLRLYYRPAAMRQAQHNDSCYLQELYQLTDEEIRQHLSGKLSTPGWWQATQLLEHSLGGWLLHWHPLPTLRQLASIYGYHQLLELACERVQYQRLHENLSQREFHWTIPLAYLEMPELQPHLYVNGRKLEPRQVRWERQRQELRLLLDTTDQLQFQDELLCEIFGSQEPGAALVTVTEPGQRLKLPEQDLEIYQVWESPTAALPRLYPASDRCYRNLGDYHQYCHWEDGQLVLDEVAADTTILLRPKCLYRQVVDEVFGLEDLWHEPLNAGRLQYTVPDWSHPGQTLTLPVLNPEQVLVYVNGYELAPGIDYQLLEQRDLWGRLASLTLVIQNADHLNDLNQLSVLMVGETLLYRRQQYLTQESEQARMFRPGWNRPTVSPVFLNGEAKIGGRSHGADELRRSFNYGTLATTRMLLPPVLLQWFAGLEELRRQDYQRQEWLLAHEFTTNDLPQLLPISQQHCLYSLWFQCILADLLRGKLVAYAHGSDQAFLRQFADYDYLKEYDLVWQLPELSKRCLTVIPSYRYQFTEQPELLPVLDRLWHWLRTTLSLEDYHHV